VAASRSALARYSRRGAAVHGDSPAATLQRVNQALLAGGEVDEDSFCTLILALIDPIDPGFRIRLAVRGHPLPTVLRRDGTVTALGRPGSIVGSSCDTEFFDDEVLLEPGDTLVLVTNGLLEIHTDHGGTGRTEFEQRLSACAGMAPTAVIDHLAAAMNIDYDDAAILALHAM
jgi:sigma-B regulation protein RsbU (phosphoserine phosphatase)